MSLKEITRNALALPTDERLVLLEEICSSLEKEPPMAFEGDVLREALRRDEELGSGKTNGIAAKAVYEEIRTEFGWR